MSNRGIIKISISLHSGAGASFRNYGWLAYLFACLLAFLSFISQCIPWIGVGYKALNCPFFDLVPFFYPVKGAIFCCLVPTTTWWRSKDIHVKKDYAILLHVLQCQMQITTPKTSFIVIKYCIFEVVYFCGGKIAGCRALPTSNFSSSTTYLHSTSHLNDWLITESSVISSSYQHETIRVLFS